MNSFDSVKNYIIGWFWKIGYRIGQGLGNLGQSIFDNAIAIGFKTTILNNIDTGALLSSADDAIEQTVLNTIPESVDLESADYNSFVLLFMEEASEVPSGGTYDITTSAAHALFENVFDFTSSTGKLVDVYVQDANGDWVFDGETFWSDDLATGYVPSWPSGANNALEPIRDINGDVYSLPPNDAISVTKYKNALDTVHIYIDNTDGTQSLDVEEHTAVQPTP